MVSGVPWGTLWSRTKVYQIPVRIITLRTIRIAICPPREGFSEEGLRANMRCSILQVCITKLIYVKPETAGVTTLLATLRRA